MAQDVRNQRVQSCQNEMNLNFSTYGTEIQQARAKVMDHKGSQDWALFTYGQDNVFKVVATGDGGLDELKDEFEGSRIQFGLCRVSEPLSNLPRFVFISWCGDGVPIQMKGQFNTKVNEVCKQFHGYHVHINARTEDDVDPSDIMKKVKASSGAQYSIQSNVGNPSLAKPPPPATKYVPLPAVIQKPAIALPKAAKPAPAAKVAEAPIKAAASNDDTSQDSRHLFASVGTAYEPVKTNPKPLSSNVFAEMEKNASLEHLSGSTSSVSSVGTVTRGMTKSEKSTFKTSLTNLKEDTPSNQSVHKSQPKLNEIAKSSDSLNSGYQPIKLEPKPLYGAGVAKASFSKGNTSPYGSSSSLKAQSTIKKSQENLSTAKPDATSSYTPYKPPTNTTSISVAAKMKSDGSSSQNDIRGKMDAIKLQEQSNLDEMKRQRELQAQEDRDQKEKERIRQDMLAQQEMEKKQREDAVRREKEQREKKHREEVEQREKILLEQKRKEEAEIAARQKLESEKRQAEEKREAELRAQQKQTRLPAAEASVHLTAIAIYDYDKGILTLILDESNEINLREGELITEIVEIDNGWWQGRNAAGEFGLFPSNYVEKQIQVSAIAPASVTGPGLGKRVIALYDYDATDSTELTIKEGQVITNVDFVSDDWWAGTIGGASGLCTLY